MSAVFGAIAMLAAAAALGITPTMLTTTSAFAWEDNNKYQAATVAEEVAKEAANNVQTPDKWDNNLQVGIHKVQDQIADAAQEISNGKQGANEEQESNEEYHQREEKENYPAEQQHEYPTREHEEEYPAEEQMEYPPHTEEYPVEEQQHAYPPRHEEEYPTEVKMEYPPHEEKEYQTQGAESEEHTIQQENNNNNNDDEGCSPNYWKNNLASWEVTRYSPDQKLSEVTDLGNAIPSEYDYTLLEALDTQNGGYDALAREFAAALLNSDHPNVKYALSTDKVIHNFEDGADPQIINSQEYYNDNDMQEQKNSLSDNNRAGCPL